MGLPEPDLGLRKGEGHRWAFLICRCLSLILVTSAPPQTLNCPQRKPIPKKTPKTLNLRVGHQASEVKIPFFTYQALLWEWVKPLYI